LIVACHGCGTRFQLDATRVPLRGIRVRCSRCKKAFFLAHPSATGEEAVHDVARSARDGAPPEVTQDLPGSAAIEGGPPRPSSREVEHEEEDWEFSEDVPGDEDEPEPVRGAPPETSSRAPSVEESGAGADGPRLDIGGRLDLGAPEEEDDLAAETSLGELDGGMPAAETPGPGLDLGADEQAVGEPEDDPEEWDFFGGEVDEPPPGPSPVAAQERAAPEPAAPRGVASAARAPLQTAALAPGLPAQEGALAASTRRITHALGWVLTAGLLAAGLAGGLLSARPTVTGPASVRVAGLGVHDVRGRWVETARAGKVFAVGGELANPDRDRALVEGGLQVALVAADGSRLEAPVARAGFPPLDEAQLRELPLDALRALQQRAALQLAGLELESRESIPIFAFFETIPESAVGFRLEPGEIREWAEPTPAADPPGLPADAEGAAG
jgi:predicted Zn finger-like uncharacterized protein